ncbi:MAG: AAA family ATPase [Gemmatimonas sp.]|nr:AAA family ATPase [Gemmatimonas sp.]
MKHPIPNRKPHLRGLNPAQLEAVLALEGPVLVIAGAGSGKTRTLAYRIAHLLENGVEPRKIAAVTFTNRAASEMRERVAAMVGKAARSLTLSTFHSLGARILRAHGKRLGLPDHFAIYSTADQLALVRRILAEEIHIAATAGEEVYDVKRVLSDISAWKNRMLTPAETRQEVAEGHVRGNRSDDYAVLAADMFPRYEQALRACGACDFDDLLLLPVTLLRDHPEVREAMWRRWHYLMVDEYQDTNSVQLEMARLLAGPRRNLCVVGDDDQSIYAWRGADLRNILDFERHFPGARVVVLEENYRSTQRILEAANGVIAHNPARRPKQMRTENGLGPKIDYWEFDRHTERSAEEREAQMVASEIGIRRFHERLGWRDFAVLYRANHQARPLEEALRRTNVPYRVVGGTSYFDRKEIADAAAYLRVLVNPRDDLSLRRIVNFPTRGIGRTTLLRLVDAARVEQVPITEAMRRVRQIDPVNAAQAEAVEAFVDLTDRARERLHHVQLEIHEGRRADVSLASWVEEFLREIRLTDAVQAESSNERMAQARANNLRDFIQSVGDYERQTWADAPLPDEELDWEPPTLNGFLQGVSLYADADPDNASDDPGADEVTLVTLHSAKGLEFSHVFLVGLEEEILPHARSVQEASNELAPDPIAEERRLFYVGITRARHRLTLSSCRTRRRGAESIPRQPSRFLKEIPAELLDVRLADGGSSLSDSDKESLRENFFDQMREMLG